MITSSILFIFLGSFMMYNTSRTALLSTNLSIEKWVQNNHLISKTIGLSFFIMASIMIIIAFGLTSGILFWFVSLILILGLLVIVSPLKIITYKHIIVLFSALFILELLF